MAYDDDLRRWSADVDDINLTYLADKARELFRVEVDGEFLLKYRGAWRESFSAKK